MIRYIYLVLACVLMSTLAYSQSQSIQGRIYDANTNEGLPFANVILLKDGIQKAGTTTDLDGNYSFTGFDPGVYSVEAVYVGYPNARIEGVSVSASQSLPLDIEMAEAEGGVSLEDLEVVVKAYKIPLIRQDETASGNTLGGEDIKKLPTRSVGTLIATTAAVSQDKEGTDVSFRGAREGDQIVYVDGVRVRGNSVPAQDIEQIQVITGGVPAAYGDVTGGVTNIITKGAASQFSGAIDLETSEGLDGFGYNFATASLSGPIWKRNIAGVNGATREETVLGFRVSGQFLTQGDPFPSYLGSYRATPDFVSNMMSNPYNADGTFLLETLDTDTDIERLTARENARSTNYTLNGKLDFVPTSGMTFTVGGQYVNSDAKQAFNSYKLLNYDRNPSYMESDWRAFARFRHTIGGNLLDLSDDEREARTSALIQNINYSLQFDISQNRDLYYDNVHQDNLMSYGYVAGIDRDIQNRYVERELVVTAQGDSLFNVINHEGYTATITGYNPSENNAALAAYYDGDALVGSIFDTNINGAFNNPDFYRFLYTSPGVPLNFYNKAQQNQIGVSANAGFDIKGQGEDNQGKHSIQFGIYYEQRLDRYYAINPAALWNIARQRINTGVELQDTYTQEGDVITYDYGNVTTDFGQNFRDALGIPYNQRVNVEGYTPDEISMDMFSADELIIDFGRLRLNYYGYDYLGNELGTDVTFNDFFTARDQDGTLTRPVAPAQPIYAAAYIQDKFSFRDMFFNLGVRVDRYDANRQVPNDPYSLYATQSASEVNATHPETVGDDFVVYGNQEAGTISAYRDGEQWYDANGNAVNNPVVIFGGSGDAPYFDNPNDLSIQVDGFDPTGFVDYEPQITVMPRISFSFPLNENAGFFAHYDVLSRRPTQTYADALDYYNFEQSLNAGSTINNPNLKPSKTIDYQVGFQQKVSESSAVKISAYYREQRDEVNQRQFIYAHPVGTYSTYDNRDFGTVKGFSFTYDLRETNNLSMKANYTLQFAEGTGSNANQNRGSTDRGDVRPFYPYDFDQRHNIVLNIDYRYKSGKRYNGPRLFNKDILANTGLNVLTSVGSGRPFTPKLAVTNPAATAGLDGNSRGGNGVDGDFNGARLPWTSRIDLRLDKNIKIGGADSKTPMFLNVYVRTQNLLNTENIVAVYGYTQSATDDGFYAPDSDVDDLTRYLYGLRLEQSGHYGLPRRIRVGASLSF